VGAVQPAASAISTARPRIFCISISSPTYISPQGRPIRTQIDQKSPWGWLTGSLDAATDTPASAQNGQLAKQDGQLAKGTYFAK
jgi:hypothetical protein